MAPTRLHPLTLALLVLASSVPWSRGATPVPEKLLPASTLAVVTVPDVNRARTAFDLNPGFRLMQDPAMKPIVDKFLAKWRTDVVAKLEQQFSIKFGDYAGLAQGQVTLAWMMSPPPPGKEEPKLSSLLLLDAGTNSAQLKTTLESLRKKWVDGGHQVKVEKIRGLEFTALIMNSSDIEKVFDKVFPPKKEEEEPKGRGKGKDRDGKKEAPERYEWLVGQSDSLLLFGNSAADIEKVLSIQAGGGGSTLSELPAFAGDVPSVIRDSQVYLWVNLQEIVKVGKKLLAAGEGRAKRPGDNSPDPAALIDSSGLGALRSLAYSQHTTAEGSSYDLRISVPESERKGIIKMLAFPAKEASPPPFVPSDVLSFSRSRLDLSKAFDTLEATIIGMFPSSSSVIKMVMESAGKDKDPNFDLRKSLFSNLGDDSINYTKAPKERTLAALGNPPSVHLIAAKDPEQLANAVKVLVSQFGPQTTKKDREFQGKKIFSVSLPGSQRPVSIASSGGYLVVSDDDAALEEYLRSSDRKSPPLRDAPGLSQDAGKVRGMGTGLFGYVNGLESARLQFEALRKESGSVANLLGALPIGARLGFDEDTKAFKEWVDLSLLPPFDQVSQYFNHTVWGGVFSPDAFELRFFEPVPPKLKK